MLSIAFNIGEDVASVSKDIYSIAAIGIPIHRITSPLKLITTTPSITHCRFPELLARDSDYSKVDIEVLNTVVKEG